MPLFRKTEKTLENLSRFKKAKFNYQKFVKHYYMENDEAYITAKVQSIDDIVSRYSVKDYEWINEEFTSYIDNCAYHIPVEEAIVLEITGRKFTDSEKEIIQRVIKEHYGLALGETDFSLRVNSRRALVLFLWSIVTAIIFFLLYTYTNSILLELIVVGLWFFTWELGSVAWINRADLKNEKLEAGQLSSLRIKFTDEVEE